MIESSWAVTSASNRFASISYILSNNFLADKKSCPNIVIISMISSLLSDDRVRIWNLIVRTSSSNSIWTQYSHKWSDRSSLRRLLASNESYISIWEIESIPRRSGSQIFCLAHGSEKILSDQNEPIYILDDISPRFSYLEILYLLYKARPESIHLLISRIDTSIIPPYNILSLPWHVYEILVSIVILISKMPAIIGIDSPNLGSSWILGLLKLYNFVAWPQ